MGKSSSKLDNESKELEKLIQSTQFSLAFMESLSKHFKRLAKDGKFLTRKDFISGIRSSGVNTTIDLLYSIYDVFDHDNNGSVDFQELVMTLAAFVDTANPDAVRRLAFVVFDIDGTGKISKAEFKKCLQCLNNSLELTEFSDMISLSTVKRAAPPPAPAAASPDTKKSPIKRVNTLALDEFKLLGPRDFDRAIDDFVDQCYELYDVSRDGFLHYEEFIECIKHHPFMGEYTQRLICSRACRFLSPELAAKYDEDV